MTGPSSNPNGEGAPLRGELPPATLLAPSEPVPPSATEELHGGRRLRPRLDQLTDDQLDQLYADLDTLEAVCDSNKRAYVGAVKDAMAADERAKRAEQVAADLRTQTIAEQKRAEKAEADRDALIDERDKLDRQLTTMTDVARSNRAHVQTIVPDLEKAEAAIARVRALHAPGRDWGWKPFGCEHHGAHAQPCAHCGVCSPCPTLTALDTTA